MARTPVGIALNSEERNRLSEIINDANETARSKMRAKILLASDFNGAEKKTILELANELGTTHTTIQTVRNEYAKGGIDQAIYRKTRTVSRKTRKINDDVIMEILHLMEEQPPEGCKKWSTRMLCKECVTRGIVEHISPSSMWKIVSSKEEVKKYQW